LEKVPPRAHPQKLLYINRVSVSVCLSPMPVQRQIRHVDEVLRQSRKVFPQCQESSGQQPDLGRFAHFLVAFFVGELLYYAIPHN
jgi:hypothetical protein